MAEVARHHVDGRRGSGDDGSADHLQLCVAAGRVHRFVAGLADQHRRPLAGGLVKHLLRCAVAVIRLELRRAANHPADHPAKQCRGQGGRHSQRLRRARCCRRLRQQRKGSRRQRKRPGWRRQGRCTRAPLCRPHSLPTARRWRSSTSPWIVSVQSPLSSGWPRPPLQKNSARRKRT